MNRTSPECSPKPVTFGLKPTQSSTCFGIFRPKAGPKLKPKIKVFSGMDPFAPTYHQDIPHHPPIANNAGYLIDIKREIYFLGNALCFSMRDSLGVCMGESLWIPGGWGRSPQSNGLWRIIRARLAKSNEIGRRGL